MKRFATLPLLSSALCWGLAAIAGATPPQKLPPLELPVPEAALKEVHHYWYGIYLNGSKIGWGVENRQPATVEGKACVSTVMEMHMEMKALGNVMKVETVSREHYTVEPPYRAFLIEDIQKMDGQERRIVVRHKEDTNYTAEITEGGKRRTENNPLNFDLRLCHTTSPEIWAADPARRTGDAIGMVEFSADNLTTGQQTATLLAEADWAGPGGKLPVWEMDLYDHEQKMAVTARISRSDGSLVNAVFGQMIEVRMEPEKVAKQMPGDAQPDMFLAMSIPADRKLGRASDLTELVIELSAPEGKRVPEFPDTVNQTAERDANGRVTLRITPGAGKAQPATGEERTEALKATSRYLTGDDSIKQLAEKAVAGATSEREKVKNLLRFTDAYIRDSYEIEALSVLDLLQTRKGDCSAHALLFANLARASGLPAREVSGWMYMGNEYQSFGGHAWNEVVLDGQWLPVDPIWKQSQLDAGHLQHHSGEIDGKMLEGLVAGLKARVISFKKN